ncbi:DUF4286 family protein [Mesohalobacter halotolerans]|uniref:DUF4286 family protein n=1 Tax=Mesohalobacter halotolerans TaxID=1883405 RepID=A0A4U5TTZ2_9FLAO|nr:DUF4286 family protein [Mesohalobacter halotolerans]TKS56964.1 DUF4286 family protein [Mesohalobacter halotolerans]
MYIFNTTFNIELKLVDQCVKEIEFNLISDLLDTGLIEKAILTEVLSQDQSGKTFSLQLFYSTKAHLTQFQKFHNQTIEQWVRAYSGKVLFFQTPMRVIGEKA